MVAGGPFQKYPTDIVEFHDGRLFVISDNYSWARDIAAYDLS
jgi:hypothetical protein